MSLGLRRLLTNSKIKFHGWVAQLVRVLSQYAKAVGLILGLGTCKNQPMDV